MQWTQRPSVFRFGSFAWIHQQTPRLKSYKLLDFFHVQINLRPVRSQPPPSPLLLLLLLRLLRLPSLFLGCLFPWSWFREVLRGRIVLIFSTLCLANNVEGTVEHISAGRHLKGRQPGAGTICIKPPWPLSMERLVSYPSAVPSAYSRQQ